MTKRKGSRLLSFALAALMLTGVFSAVRAGAEEVTATLTQSDDRQANLQSITEILSAIPYDEYDVNHKDDPRGTEEYAFEAVNCVDADHEKTTVTPEITENYEGKSAVILPETGSVTFKLDVPKAGRYVLEFEYCPVSEKTNSIERILYINDRVPFSEARFLQFKKHWELQYQDGFETVADKDSSERRDKAFRKDAAGNEIRPESKSVKMWLTYVCTDKNGFHTAPFEFYFDEGENTLTLEPLKEEVALHSITLRPAEDEITWKEYKKSLSGKSKGADEIYLDAETPSAVSDATIFPNNNRTSSITHPQHATHYLLNALGDSTTGYTVGQWMEYSFDVDTAGLYTFVFRYKQSFNEGVFVSRKIYIDGEVPFKEANNLRFYSSNNFKITETKVGDETAEFYLTKGHHTLRIETSLGDMAEIISTVSNVQKNANADYLQILRLTGADPDKYRDYGFMRIMPDTIKDLSVQSKELNRAIDELRTLSKGRSEQTALLEQAAILMKKMGGDEDQVARNLGSLKSQLGTLGTWVNDAKKQPLQLDYILVRPAGQKLPRAEGNFFDSAKYELGQFFGSFFTDYSALGVEDNKGLTEETLQAWTVSGRDQAQIIRTQINNKFAPETGIPVTLKLVSGDALLPAILAGIGPDLALEGTAATNTTGTASGDIMDYAMRGALLDLNGFEDLDEIKQRFSPSAFINLELYGKTYGLPVKQEWMMMFYRTDVLAALGLDPPETWDELLALIPVLQYNNMDIGIGPGLELLSTMTFQRGSTIWTDDGMRINLDSNTVLEAFDYMANMYTQFSLPVTFDVANRFRTGEMPLTIGGYASTYNSIVVFATEIAGLWDFAPIPGIRQPDGTINRTCNAGSDPVSMTKDCSNPDNAWKFMKWYTDKDFQVTYSNELIAVIGEAAKNATANLSALEELSWTRHEYDQLMIQSEQLSANPSYPGKYFLGRYVSFSINNVYNQLADPIETLLGYTPTINKEITRKRTEFGFETLEAGQTLAEKRSEEAVKLLDGLSKSDRDKYSAQIGDVKKAIDANNADLIRTAATTLTNANSKLFAEAVDKLNEAAKWLDTYK